MKHYRVMEVFYSLQGEGARAGTANVFVRFAGCNLDCTVAQHGFDCDTDWKGGTAMTGSELRAAIDREWPFTGLQDPSIILTGGEPTLQMDEELLGWLPDGAYVAVETNCTRRIPTWVDYVAGCPKRGEPILDELLAEGRLNELRMVVQADTTVADLRHMERLTGGRCALFVSPAFDGDALNREALDAAIELVRACPRWRLSMQQHKIWNVR